jgi:hypothetical protein
MHQAAYDYVAGLAARRGVLVWQIDQDRVDVRCWARKG